MTDRDRSLSPTPRERALMSEREMMLFTLERTDALGEAIADLAKVLSDYHGEAKHGIERMSYVAMKLEERDADHETRLRDLEKKVYWVGGAAAAVGLIGGLVLNLVK
jgi:hypothetical protein